MEFQNLKYIVILLALVLLIALWRLKLKNKVARGALITFLFISLVFGFYLHFSEIPQFAKAATITAAAGGGNWTDGGTWVGGVAPTAADDAVLGATSGNITINTGAVARSVDASAYTGTLTHTAGVTLTVGDASGGALNFSGAWTYTRGSNASAISFVSTSDNGGAGWNITWGGKTPGNLTFNGVGGKWKFQDGYSNSGQVMNITRGELDTNGQTITLYYLYFANSADSKITLGTSTIHLSTWNYSSDANFVFSADPSSTIDLYYAGNMYFNTGGKTYNNNVTFTGAGDGVVKGGVGTFNNLSKIGVAAKTDSLFFYSNQTINGTLTLTGNSVINRILVRSEALGTARTITAAAVDIDNVDFMDITGAGAAAPFTGVSLGDCGGNSQITTDTPVAQTWNDATGGNWSDSGNWTSGTPRVPLPQDNVSFTIAFNSGVTVAADMPRIGKDVDWSGATWAGTAPAWTPTGTYNYMYGSLTLVSGMTYTAGGNSQIHLQGRSSHTITSAAVHLYDIGTEVPGSTYTLTDALYVDNRFSPFPGNFTSAGYNITVANYFRHDSGTLNISNSTITLSGSGSVWQNYNTGVTATNSTISLTYTGASATSFLGYSGVTYNNISVAPGSNILTVSGSFTFANMTMASAGTKTVKFDDAATFTMTGTNFLRGTAGNLVTISSDAGGSPFHLSKASGMVSCDYLSLQDSHALGGATFYAGSHSTNVSGNDGWLWASGIIISPAGGNWDAGTAWVGGVVPTAADDVFGIASSGALTINVAAYCRSIDLSAYTSTMTHNTGITLSIGDATVPAGGSALNFSGAWTYTKGSTTTSAISFVSTNASTHTITWGGKTPGNLTFNGTGATFQYQDGYTNTAQVLTLTAGTLDVNAQTISFGTFSPANSANAILTLTGNSNVTVSAAAGWNPNSYDNWVLNCGTSTVHFAGSGWFSPGTGKTYYSVLLDGAGLVRIYYSNATSFTNFTRIGTATTTDSLQILQNITVTGTLTLTGNSTTNRLLVSAYNIGTAITLTAAAVDIDNVDFMDITGAGAAAPFTGISLGDCGGNSQITTDVVATQTWDGNTGNWSTAARWTSRVPLPQDDVVLAGTNTVTADMPRLGKSISFSGATPLTLNNDVTNYGSLNFTNAGTFTPGNTDWVFGGRGSYTITSAGKTINFVGIMAPGGTYTLADTMNSVGILYIAAGTFNTGGNILNTLGMSSCYGYGWGLGVRALNISNSSVSLSTAAGTSYPLDFSCTTNFSVTATGSTINLTYAGASARTAYMGNYTYNNIVITPGGAGTLTFSDTFTFANMTMASAGTKTIKFTKTTTYTMTGTNFLNGTAGNMITIDSDDGATPFTMNKASGLLIVDFVAKSRMQVGGGAVWYSTANSTPFPDPNINGNTGWTASGSGGIKTISPAGGNWSTNGAWNEGSPPLASENVYALASSGSSTIDAASVARSVDMSLYPAANTLTHNTGITLSIGDATAPAAGSALNFTGSWTYTKGSTTTSAISFVSTNASTHKITWGGKTPGNLTFNGTGATFQYQDGYTNTAQVLTVTAGELDVNAQTISFYNFAAANSANAILTLTGNSNLTVSRWDGSASFVLNCGTSTVTWTGTGTNFRFNSQGKTFYNVISNRTGGAGGDYAAEMYTGVTATNFTATNGSATKAASLSLNGNISVTGTLTLQGDSVINRLLVFSSVLGTARTLTAAVVDIDNVDFMDMTGAGAAAPFTGVSLGDCGGNTSITTDAPVAQTWNNATGGNWSDVGNWTSGTPRVPLPQDDVSFNFAFNPGVTIMADMPRLGKSINWTGATNNPTWNLNNTTNTSYGSLTLISGMSVMGTISSYHFSGRSSYTITSASKALFQVFIEAPGGTYTLTDALTANYRLSVSAGSFNSAGYNINTEYGVASTGTITRSVDISNSTISISGFNVVLGWEMVDSGLTLTTTGSTIAHTYTGANNGRFVGGTKTYNNITFAGGGAGYFTFSGAFTFANMTMASAGAKTIKFTKTTTYTMTGTNFLNGTSGNVITIDSDDGATPFTMNKASGLLLVDFVAKSRMQVGGGATWYSTANSTPFPDPNINGNSGWTASGAGGIKTISPAGGNWSTNGAWNEGSPPLASENVYALASSGSSTIDAASVARSVDMSLYPASQTLTHNTGVTLSIGDASGGALNFTGAWTYTKGSTTTSALSFVSTSNNGGAGWPITWGGHTPGNITYNGVGGKWKYQDGYTNTSQILTLTAGELDTNGQAISIRDAWFANSANAILTLGSSTITYTNAWNSLDSAAFILNAGTSTIIGSGASVLFYGGAHTYYTLSLTGSGTPYINDVNTFTNLSRTGTAVKTDGFALWSNQTVTGTLTIQGNSTTNRLLVTSRYLGTAITLTAAAVDIDNVDFMDITGAGAAAPFTGVSLGDCGGNTNITTDAPVAQTWNDATGGNWSDIGNWTSGTPRVPLPQDDVSMAVAGGYNSGVTVTADMPRLAKSIDWSGASWTGTATTFNFNNTNTIYGSLTLISGLQRIHGGNTFTFAGRTAGLTITSAGVQFGNIAVTAPGGTYTLTDAFANWSEVYSFALNNGTFNTGGYNFTIGSFISSNSNTRAFNCTNSLVTVTYRGSSMWDTSTTTGMTFTAAGSTIAITNTVAGYENFNAGALTYNNFQITPSSSSYVLFSGSFTFANMTMESVTRHPVI